MNRYEEADAILKERFGHDVLISVATVDGDMPAVRTVNSYYEDGAFYTITHALSGKIKQMEVNPNVAICGEWYTARGKGENLGHIRAEQNADMTAKLREAFAEWLGNGHVDEADPNTCILCMRMTEGVLFNQGTRYDIDFAGRKA